VVSVFLDLRRFAPSVFEDASSNPACQVDFLVFSETVLTNWLKTPHTKLSPLISERGSMRAHHASNHFGRHVQCTRRTLLFGFGLARLAAAHFFVIQTQAPACTRKS
jgi:hypothetical protein